VDDRILDLKCGTADVRSEAAEALGDIGDPWAVDPLLDIIFECEGPHQEIASGALQKIEVG